MSTEGLAVIRLSIVIPCYNEETALPETARRLLLLLSELRLRGEVSHDSALYIVDDGSKDETWRLVEKLAAVDSRVEGLKLSRNYGHQSALLAGLFHAPGDVLISIDADLQDDPEAIRQMLAAHREGAEIVYGVRRSRNADSVFKRVTAESYYRILAALGAEVIFNHADYRLLSRRTINALRQFEETNLFIRGIIPRLGFPTATVFYDRSERCAGESKYPLTRMFALAVDGVTSFSAKPLRLITIAGMMISLLSFAAGGWALWARLVTANVVPGWASTLVPMFFLGGVQLLSLGVIGEYIAKIYSETKRRPRYFIERLARNAPSLGLAGIDPERSS